LKSEKSSLRTISIFLLRGGRKPDLETSEMPQKLGIETELKVLVKKEEDRCMIDSPSVDLSIEPSRKTVWQVFIEIHPKEKEGLWMYVVNLERVRAYPLNVGKNVTVRYLLHAGVGAKRIQLRLFAIEPGGYTPLERHEHEHEVYLLRGRLLLKGEDKEISIGVGDAVFIASMELHQFSNFGEEPAEFLCTKETSDVPEILKKT